MRVGRLTSEVVLFSVVAFKTLSATKLWGIHWPNYPCKKIGGECPFYLKYWVKVTALAQNRRFSIYFRS